MSYVSIVHQQPPNIILRGLWFLFIGWWLGGMVAAIAWLCNITIFLLPLGLWLINRLPTVITLRPQEQDWRLDEDGSWLQGKEQAPFLVRAVYFLLIGWWASGIWMALAYSALMTVILIPVAFWMYNRVGAVTTLYRS